MSVLSALRFLSLFAALAAFGADFGALQPQGYVSDFARVLDAATVQQLNAYCGRVEQSTGAQLAIVTVDTLEGEPAEDVANLLFRKWGIGKKGENNGALFLLAIRDRKSRLEVGYGLEPILPDGFAGSVLREMRPALRQNDYRTALSTATAIIGQRIAQEKGVTITDAPVLRRTKRSNDFGPWPFFGLLAFIWFLSMLGGSRRSAYSRTMPGAGVGNVLTGMILGQLLGGGRNRGGGGFGGYDSGGGFGGFGGGDSGGGGASSDW